MTGEVCSPYNLRWRHAERWSGMRPVSVQGMSHQRRREQKTLPATAPAVAAAHAGAAAGVCHVSPPWTRHPAGTQLCARTAASKGHERRMQRRLPGDRGTIRACRACIEGGSIRLGRGLATGAAAAACSQRELSLIHALGNRKWGLVLNRHTCEHGDHVHWRDAFEGKNLQYQAAAHSNTCAASSEAATADSMSPPAGGRGG